MSSICIDCKQDTCPRPGRGRRTSNQEYYMVLDKVWTEAGMTFNGGMLCIGCLEKRIGRELTPSDFKDIPMNGPGEWDSERLRNRKWGKDVS